jgi:hypothetical protein
MVHHADTDSVFDGLNEEFRAASTFRAVAMVAKLSNACIAH